MRLKLAEAITVPLVDRRGPARVQHGLAEMALARTVMIAAGYEDCDDIDAHHQGARGAMVVSLDREAPVLYDARWIASKTHIFTSCILVILPVRRRNLANPFLSQARRKAGRHNSPVPRA